MYFSMLLSKVTVAILMATVHYGNQRSHKVSQFAKNFLQTSQTAAIMNGRKMVKVRTKMEDTNPAMISPSRERRQLGSHMSGKKTQKTTTTTTTTMKNTTLNDRVLYYMYFRTEWMELVTT